MKIHEYQAKELLKQNNIPVPKGGVAFTVSEALKIANKLKGEPVVIKAQIHAGGRGKGGGIKSADSLDEVNKITEKMLGMNLITEQTSKNGKVVHKVLVEQRLKITKELYLAISIDRQTAEIIIITSLAGGVDIENTASETPSKIVKIAIDPLSGIQKFHLRKIIFDLNISKAVVKEFSDLVANLYTMFIKYDCSLLEINPLVLTTDNRIFALDAKMDIDNNALFRQKDICKYRDIQEEDPFEVKASKFNLNYINLNGNIGNIVNGAGLAMATMDIIKKAGAEPANFMDVGGGATSEMVENALKIILLDKKVKGILINIFGGILRCDVFAQGIVQAAEKTGIKIPIVIRMEGTNLNAGKKILAKSKLKLITASTLKDAALKIANIIYRLSHN